MVKTAAAKVECIDNKAYLQAGCECLKPSDHTTCILAR